MTESKLEVFEADYFPEEKKEKMIWVQPRYFKIVLQLEYKMALFFQGPSHLYPWEGKGIKCFKNS